jgi:glycogen phosphorylase
MRELDPFIHRTLIAYFTMEIAIRPEMHTYAGGLGILAGDTMRSCADLEIPSVFVTLMSREGYFRQEIVDGGRQVEHPDPWDPAQWAKPLMATVGVEIEGRDVWIRPWLYIHAPPHGLPMPVLLLDTDLDQNDSRDRTLTHQLYGDGEKSYRLKQEIVLGLGGVRVLRALGFEIQTYHLNEGHAAFAPVELLRYSRRTRINPVAGHPVVPDADRVRGLCVFTTHTPVDAGHDKFSYELVAKTTSDLLPPDEMANFAGTDCVNMTRLALNLSSYVNGVAKRHATTARRMFPGYDVRAITNGVHPGAWAHPAFASLFQSHYPNWVHEPEVLTYADHLSDDEIWRAHETARKDLCELVGRITGRAFKPDVPIIGFARRMTGYKRADLLFSDLGRLMKIAEKHPFQIVLAGKAHPHDQAGKEQIRKIYSAMRELEGTVPVCFLPNYDMTLAQVLVSGSDVWLNTPLPPLEASGTSGMKAALNGVLNLSTLDGWWLEACIEGSTGWAIDGDGNSDADSLYRKLADTVLPLYYNDRARWIWMMKQAISKIASYFNSQRMMRRYATEAYIR